jgi:hypothetical protein
MPFAHNCSARTVVENTPGAYYLRPRRRLAGRGGIDVKYLLSAAALAGSLGILLSDWAGQAFPYL